MIIRKYKPSDCSQMARLFYDTVHSVNSKDYCEEQLFAWANGTVDLMAWNNLFVEHYTLVAEIGTIVGFGDIDKCGYLDKLYVHKDFQGKGIATAIVNQLEQFAITNGINKISTYSSITAKPFFEKLGYTTIKQNIVIRKNIKLINYLMEKTMNLKN